MIPSLIVGLALLAACAQPPLWNVVVVTFDTTRADHLACYGKEDVKTPVLDALAAEGTLFEQAAAAIPITLPSHSSLMTGKVPFTHGVRDNGLFVLGEEQITLAEILRERGYRTAAAIGAYPLTAEFGIDQGFELFDDHLTTEYEDIHGQRVFPKQKLFFDERKAARVNEAILPWLEENHREPFFLWAHYFDPHHPHEPPPPYDQLYAHDPYLGEIAYSDESLGTLINTLKRLGVYERTLVVFTSDHGEGRGEHDESTHSLLLYDSTLHVPLIVKAPDSPQGQRVRERVGIMDVLPTVLDYLGLEAPEGIQGQSLRPYLEGDPERAPKRRPLYAETLSPRLSRDWGELRSLYYEQFQYIHGPRPELYDLAQDPRQLRDLMAERPEVAANLRGRLASYLEENAVKDLDASVEMDPETIRRLQALGYLHGSGEKVGPIDERLREDGDPPQDHAGTITIYSHAKSLLVQEKALEAKEYIRDLLRKDEGNPHYLELLANAEIKLGRLEAALEILDQIVRSSSGYPKEKILQTAAGIHLSRGEMEPAYDKLRQAEAISETPLGQYRLAKIHESRGEAYDSRRFLAKTLELDPTYVAARIDLAVHHAQDGDIEQADAEFARAMADHPYMARLFYNYGAFLMQTERPEMALGYFQRAAELKPDYPQALYALVELHAGRGELKEAREHHATLLSLAPRSREAALAGALLTDLETENNKS